MYRKINNDKGFTLPELLIIIAIIVILVGISIPIFTSQINKAKEAADKANVRSARAAAVAAYYIKTDDSSVYYYDSESGTVTTDAAKAATFKGYGKSDHEITKNEGIPNDGSTARIVKITIASDGTQSAEWTLGTKSTTDTLTGAITLTGTDGSTHSVTAVSTWNELKGSSSGGFSITPGSVFTGSNGNTYLFCSWSGWISDHIDSAEDYASAHPGNVINLTTYTEKVLVQSDLQSVGTSEKWSTDPANGTICYINNTYYVAPNQLNAWTVPPDGWIKIEQ